MWATTDFVVPTAEQLKPHWCTNDKCERVCCAEQKQCNPDIMPLPPAVIVVIKPWKTEKSHSMYILSRALKQQANNTVISCIHAKCMDIVATLFMLGVFDCQQVTNRLLTIIIIRTARTG